MRTRVCICCRYLWPSWISFNIKLTIFHLSKQAPKKKTPRWSFFCKRSQVKCPLLCISQTYATKWRRQHGPQYLNGSWCVGCDGYDLTWWAIYMSDMSSIHTKPPTSGALPKNQLWSTPPKFHQWINQICHWYRSVSLSAVSEVFPLPLTTAAENLLLCFFLVI